MRGSDALGWSTHRARTVSPARAAKWAAAAGQKAELVARAAVVMAVVRGADLADLAVVMAAVVMAVVMK